MPNELELTYQGSATLYAILRRRSDAQVWNGSALEPWSDDHLPTYALPLASRGGDLYQADFPSTDPAIIPAALYRLIYYRQSDEAPDITDLLLATRDLHWDGQSLTTAPPPDIDLDPYALTTLPGVKQFLRIDPGDSSNDDFLTTLINQTSARIESICRRQFLARDYVERYAASSTNILLLRHRPVLHINRIAAGSAPALRLQFTNTALRASASLALDQLGCPTTLRLTVTAADGGTTLSALNFSDHPTTGSLAAAVNALPGWQAVTLANTPSLELNPTATLDALSPNAFLTYPDRDLSTYTLNHLTAQLTLPHNPPRLPAGPLGRPPRPSPQPIFIQYHAGYQTLPPDLQLITHELIAQAYQLGKQNLTFRSESFPAYSYTRQSLADLTADQSARLQPYLDIR